MQFSEKIKREVKEKSNFQCILCGNKLVEVHHIILQNEGENGLFENAVALCARCHMIFGGNPLKRKEIIEKRNLRYKQNEKKEEWYYDKKYEDQMESIKYQRKKDNIVINIDILEKDNFERAVNKIYFMIYQIQHKNPNKKIILIVNIDGQREDIPDELDIFSKEREVIKFIKEKIKGRGHILEKACKSYEQNERKFIYMRDRKNV